MTIAVAAMAATSCPRQAPEQNLCGVYILLCVLVALIVGKLLSDWDHQRAPRLLPRPSGSRRRKARPS